MNSIFLFIFILIILSFLLFVLIKKQYIRNKLLLFQEQNIKKQADLIIKQNNKIKYQKEQIDFSIENAKRIQQAVLPSTTLINDLLADYFIFYKPKDVVSGDFYWISKVDNKVILVTADCTGHGVPGAFMSLLGIIFLNDLINKDKILSADVILNKLREKVISAINQYGSSIKQDEGMDLSLIIINKDNLEMEFAGAFNSCYIIRDNEINELKADLMPIGKIDISKIKPFTSKKFQLIKGDNIYCYSDGFKDQFGGPNGTKIKTKLFKEILLKMQEKSMKEQYTLLEKYFLRWKQGYDQTDDVTVIGINI